MQLETFGDRGEPLGQAPVFGRRNGRVALVGVFLPDERGPVDGVLAHDVGHYRVVEELAPVEMFAVFLDVALGVVRIDHAALHEVIGIEFARTRMLPDAAIHQRLVTAGSSCSLCPSLRKHTMSTTTSFLNSLRNSMASCITKATASGSSPLTWKMGASAILKMSVQ